MTAAVRHHMQITVSPYAGKSYRRQFARGLALLSGNLLLSVAAFGLATRTKMGPGEYLAHRTPDRPVRITTELHGETVEDAIAELVDGAIEQIGAPHLNDLRIVGELLLCYGDTERPLTEYLQERQ